MADRTPREIRQRSMRAVALSLFCLSLGALLSISGCESGTTVLAAQSASPQQSNSTATPPEPVIAGPPVRKTLILTTTQPGRIEAFESAPLYAKVSGYVTDVLVDIGDKVEKDSLIIDLAVPELDDEREQKRALVAQATAEVGQAVAAQRASEAVLASARAAIDHAKAGVGRTEAEYERWKAESARVDSLAGSGSITQKVADETRNQFRAADAARHEAVAMVRSAEAALAEAEAGIAKAKADVVAAKARLAVAEADLKRVETMLGYTQIKAPFGGVVTQRNVDTGHFVPQGGTGSPIAAVMRTDRVRVFLDVPEIEAAKVDVGDAAVVRIQALDGLQVPGEVTRNAWALDVSNRTLRTEIDLENENGRLRPGMYATATIELDRRSDVLTLPVSAILRAPEGAYCFVIQNGRAVKTPIALGLRVGNDWEIAQGLSGSETVALAKAESLTDGKAVEPIHATQ